MRWMWCPGVRYGVAAWLVLISLLYGCRSEREGEEPASLNRYHQTATELEGTVLVQADWLVSPAALKVIGGQLYVGEAGTEPFIHRVSLEDGSLIASWGQRGEGPGEFSTVASFTVAGDDLWAFDPNERRLTAVTFQSSSSEIPSVTFQGDRSLLDPVWFSDSVIVAVVFDPEFRIGLFDQTGQQKSLIGIQPREEGVPSALRPYLNHTRMTVHPDEGIVFLASRWSSRVYLLHLDASIEKKLNGPVEFISAFKLTGDDGRPTMVVIDDSRSGYIDLAATSDRVYALFSGRRFGDFGSEAGFGEFVHVFDWTGTYSGALRLDSPVASITVDEETNRVYAGQWEPIPRILVYELPAAEEGASG